MFGQFISRFFGQVFSAPLTIAGIIGFILTTALGFIEWKFPALFNKWGAKMKLWLWLAPALVFLIMIVVGGILVSYQTYQQQQDQIVKLTNDLNTASERYRPTLTLGPAFTLNSLVDETDSTANITIKIKVNNIGERPAYQISATLQVAPLNNPQQLTRYDNIYNNNPVYKGTQNDIVINHIGYFSKKDNIGTIIARIFVKYNNSPIGKDGIWYDDTYWFSFNIDLRTRTVSLTPPTPEVITYFEPYMK